MSVDDDVEGSASTQLKAFVTRVQILNNERAQLSYAIADIYDEVKAHGFSVKAFKTVIRLLEKDPNRYREEQDIIEAYLQAIGVDTGDTRTSDEIIHGSSGYPSDMNEVI